MCWCNVAVVHHVVKLVCTFQFYLVLGLLVGHVNTTLEKKISNYLLKLLSLSAWAKANNRLSAQLQAFPPGATKDRAMPSQPPKGLLNISYLSWNLVLICLPSRTHFSPQREILSWAFAVSSHNLKGFVFEGWEMHSSAILGKYRGETGGQGALWSVLCVLCSAVA